jgi:hypothetical protein
MQFEFSGEIWYWKGPAPWYFVTVPEKVCEEIKDVSGHVTYGWGMIPVTARIGNTSWYTAMFPKDGKYLLPIKTQVRKAEGLEEGDEVCIRIEVAKRNNQR